jgi:hypothetical protein
MYRVQIVPEAKARNPSPLASRKRIEHVRQLISERLIDGGDEYAELIRLVNERRKAA